MFINKIIKPSGLIENTFHHIMLAIIIIITAVIAIAWLLIIKVRKSPELIVGCDDWDGSLPGSEPEFMGPCYVYTDGVESRNIRFKVPIIGYRIAPDLILYVYSAYDLRKSEILSFCQKRHVLPFTTKDVSTLKKNLKHLNILVTAIEESPLPEEDFWVDVGTGFEIYSLREGKIIPQDKRSLEEKSASLIMKIER